MFSHDADHIIIMPSHEKNRSSAVSDVNVSCTLERLDSRRRGTIKTDLRLFCSNRFKLGFPMAFLTIRKGIRKF